MSPDPARDPPDADLSALSLTPDAERAIATVIGMLGSDPTAPTTVTGRADAYKVHVADSLSGLGFDALREARRVCDLGSGAGFPGLILAAVLPEARFDLLDSVTRKCEFMRRAAAAAGLVNVEVVDQRAETWATGAGSGAYDLVTARAVARLSTIAELASPLLRDGGSVIAWKGRRDDDEEAELARASAELGMAPVEVRWVGPYAGSDNRHLHLIAKTGPTPPDVPRRPGMAKKRPKGSQA